jgi:hypothetical protein
MSFKSKISTFVLISTFSVITVLLLPLNAVAADSVAVDIYDCSRGLIVPNGDTLSEIDGWGRPVLYELRIGISNDIYWAGMTLGFRISSPDGVALEWLPQPWPSYGAHRYVTVDTLSRMWPTETVWGFGDLFMCEAYMDGVSPDLFLLSGVALGKGLPPGPMQQMISVHFRLMGMTKGYFRTLEIDSSKVGPAGDWLYADSAATVHVPRFCGKLKYTVMLQMPCDKGGPCGSDDSKSPVPKVFGMRQNSPNPFNPSTKIAYDIPRQCQVRLDILNVEGQLVTVLVDHVQAAGSYQVAWDGTDSDGWRVPSGVYFYRIRAGENESTRKMLLLK